MGAWQEIADYTVPSNTTSVVLDNFGTITKDDFIKIVTTLNADNSFIDFNTATPVEENSNYHMQRLSASGTSVAATRQAFNFFVGTVEGTPNTSISYLKISENDRVNVFSNSTVLNSSSLQNVFYYLTSSGVTFPSGITSIGIRTKSTSVIASGSRIQIYKLAAEKVADITVASNTTQVDISNLSIDKDSEYLLVSDLSYVFDVNLLLTVNDNTTITNYYTQRIYGGGSTTFAERRNDPRIGGSPTKQLIYSHIKLSNIGAYTSQNYGIREYGTTIPQVDNWFSSSTAENITSITKLNIIGQNASPSIAAGSRFILYKLY